MWDGEWYEKATLSAREWYVAETVAGRRWWLRMTWNKVSPSAWPRERETGKIHIITPQWADTISCNPLASFSLPRPISRNHFRGLCQANGASQSMRPVTETETSNGRGNLRLNLITNSCALLFFLHICFVEAVADLELRQTSSCKNTSAHGWTCSIVFKGSFALIFLLPASSCRSVSGERHNEMIKKKSASAGPRFVSVFLGDSSVWKVPLCHNLHKFRSNQKYLLTTTSNSKRERERESERNVMEQ